MNELTLDNAIAKLMNCLTKPWADALSGLLGAPCKVALDDSAPPDIGLKPLCLGIAFDGLITGDAALVITTVDQQTLAIKSCETPQDYAESNPGIPDPELHQILRQSLVVAMKDFQSQRGPLVAKIDPCEMPSWTPVKTVVLKSSSDARPDVHAYFLCNENLRANDLAQRGGKREAATETDNLGLVLNATLEVTLRFGQQSVTLAKLATLGPGSVIELDRRVEDSIDLVLGGRVLARGEVMIVDGNYGLRVTELMDRSQL